jgi:anti-anti-sigma factor
MSPAFPVQWSGGQAIMSLPERIDLTNVTQLREQLLSLINEGSAVLIVDLTVTASCDHAAMDAIAWASQRAAVSGTQLRLVVTAQAVRRVLGVEGLDRLVSIYPTVDAALAAGTAPTERVTSAHGPAPASTRPPVMPSGAANGAMTSALLWQLVDALGDGLVLTGHNGEIVLVNRRCAEMFGYESTDLVGRPVEILVPADLRAAHQGYRADYARAPEARAMGDRVRLVGLRKDGATLPVEISLTPVPTATGHFVLAVVRDATGIRRREDLADLARAAVAEHARRDKELLDRVTRSLFRVGLSLQAAADQPAELARERIADALRELDDTISDIRGYALASPNPDRPLDPRSSDAEA